MKNPPSRPAFAAGFLVAVAVLVLTGLGSNLEAPSHDSSGVGEDAYCPYQTAEEWQERRAHYEADWLLPE